MRARYVSVRDQMDRISRRQAHRYADSTWPPVGRKIAKLAKRLYAVETDWALVTPPKDLLAAHKAYGKSISLNRKWYELEAYCYVNEYDMSGSSIHGKQLHALVSKADDAFDVYRLALTVKARQLHVKLPWKFKL